MAAIISLADGWIEWKGGACPIPKALGHHYEIRVAGSPHVVIRADAPAIERRWSRKDRATDIVAYRMVSP